MARPRKTGLDYFPFDVDFFNDEKIVAIAGEFGIKGEIATVKLLCAIYRNGYFVEWNEMLQMKMLHQLPGVSSELICSIVNRLVKWNFFDKDLFDSAGILTSKGIQKRYFDAIRKRTPISGELPYILGFRTEIPKLNDISASKTISNKEFSPEIIPKVNKSKIKNDDKSSSQKSDDEGDELLRQVNEYKNKPIWINDMMKKFHISQEEICQKLDEFYLDMRCKEIKIQKLSGMFISWLGSEFQKNKNENNQQDKFSGRRGTEPGTKSRKGFKGTF